MAIERTIDRQGDWPYPWFALGLARLGMWNRRLVVKATPYHGSGISYRRAAMDAFARAVRNDSTFLLASEDLAGLVNAMGHRLLPQDFLQPLQQAARVPGVSADVHLAIFRLIYGAGRYPEALEILGDYLRAGGDSGMARLEQARTLFALGRPEQAVETYFAGARSAGETGHAAYRADLAWVAEQWELAQFDSVAASQLGAWVRNFWQERDALALRSPGERIREHLRRWVFVHQNYLIHRPDDAPIAAEGLTSLDQASLFDDQASDDVLVEVSFGPPIFKTYERDQWEVDDRGVIYLRHGEPARKVSSVAGPPNESWAYDLPEGRKVFHFLGSRALGTTAGTTLVAALPVNADMLDARASLDSRYADLASRIQLIRAQAATKAQAEARAIAEAQKDPTSDVMKEINSIRASQPTRFRADILQREVLRNRRAIAAGVTSDGFPLHFKASLDAVVQVYGVGFGAGQARRVLAVFAVPGRKLTPRKRPDGGPGLLYPVSIRLIAMDRAAGTIRQLDTTRVFLTRDTLRGEQHLTGTVELAVPPGSYRVRTLVTSPGLDAGTGAGRDSIEIPASARDIVLSDLILGQEGGLTWPYGSQRVPLNPLNAYPKGAEATLFYEVGGLKPGTRYSSTVTVRRADQKPDAKPEFATGFEFTASGDYERVSRGLGLGNLKPGSFLLEVTVRESGAEHPVTRRRALNILDR